MPIDIIDFPATPECNGTQWSVADEERLATLTARRVVVQKEWWSKRNCCHSHSRPGNEPARTTGHPRRRQKAR